MLDTASHPGDGPAGEQNLDLARRQAAPHLDAAFAVAVTTVFDFPLRLGAAQPGVEAVKPQHCSLLDAPQVTGFDERQRQDAVVHEVIGVDASDAVRQHDPRTRIADSQRRLLTARSLAIVAAADDGVTVSVTLARAVNVGLVYRLERYRRHAG